MLGASDEKTAPTKSLRQSERERDVQCHRESDAWWG
jgi:hypothetical protein